MYRLFKYLILVKVLLLNVNVKMALIVYLNLGKLFLEKIFF